MPDGFSNPVVGGGGVLIRKSIHSPNYVPGVSGWSINEDGTAEFHGLTIVLGPGNALLVYNGTPALGNLIVAIAPASGTDAVGNHYTRGITLGGFTGPIPSDITFEDGLATTTRIAQITDYIVAATPHSDLRLLGPQNANVVGFGPNVIQGYDDNTTSGHFLQLTAGNDPDIFLRPGVVRFISNAIGGIYAVEITGAGLDINYPGGVAKLDAGNAGLLIGSRTPTPVQVNAGPKGLYYFEEFAIGAVVFASGSVVLPLATVGQPLTVTKSRKDYAGTQMALTTAVWTCPQSGPYAISAQTIYVGGVAGSRYGLYAIRNANTSSDPDLVLDVNDASARGRISVSATREYTAGDTLAFGAFQVTGAAQTIRSGPGAYISIRRCL